MIPFVKTQALGNDFLLVEHTASIPADYPELARKICDRYFGVGADGLILWQRVGDIFPIRIFNRDGSEAECSGNGLENEIRLETISGMYTLHRTGQEYSADMGVPKFKPDEVPFITPAKNAERIVNYPLAADAHLFAITACSTGNPHCSLFVDELDDTYIEKVGPMLERHAAFPHRTNVEFIHVLNHREIEVAFWERGVGRTYASGTGSCGATVASILNGYTGRQVTVHTKAGKLVVEWPEGGRLKLTSTANIVAEGNYLES